MKIPTSSFPKTVNDFESRKSKKKADIPEKITKRVSKKLAKVMYMQQEHRIISSRVCLGIALKVEGYIQTKAISLEDYKKRVLAYLQKVQKTPQIAAEINRSFEKDLLEDWLRDQPGIGHI